MPSERRPASRTIPKSDFFRGTVSATIASVIAIGVSITISLITGVEEGAFRQPAITAYVVAWPVYTAIYVAWGARVYSRLAPDALQRVNAVDENDERRALSRFLHISGTTNTTLSAAAVAVIVTIAIAQRSEFRSEPVYIALALLTVASSWVLMVYSFAQSYLRLGTATDGEHLRFQVPGPARFSDYVTLATLVSTMAATVSADFISRRAWRVIRTNVIIAFMFNSVIIAMMVSLLFGGLLA
jgi:uncharacterized membrane protein